MKPSDMGAINRQAIVDQIKKEADGLTTSELCVRVDLSERTILGHIRSLRADGVIVRRWNRWVCSC